MAGRDDPLVPLANAKLMHLLIPRSELELSDCGHLFLLTRTDSSAGAIAEFLDRRGADQNPPSDRRRPARRSS
jgi:pimeloyl-ACP methyl ester carboxylesterase